MAHVSFTARQASVLVDRIADWIAGWREALREAKLQAELRRKLSGTDDHLLRDMGLRWTGRHFERIDSAGGGR